MAEDKQTDCSLFGSVQAPLATGNILINEPRIVLKLPRPLEVLQTCKRSSGLSSEVLRRRTCYEFSRDSMSQQSKRKKDCGSSVSPWPQVSLRRTTLLACQLVSRFLLADLPNIASTCRVCFLLHAALYSWLECKAITVCVFLLSSLSLFIFIVL